MTRQEEIAGLAEKAGQLVDDLKMLKQKVGLYAGAKDDLAKAREDLGGLVEETKKLAAETHQTLASLNEIGAGKIFERLAAVEKRQKLHLAVIVLGVVLLALIQIGLFLKAH